jgi:hypothetical protein
MTQYTVDQVFNALFGQESSSGADTRTSPRDAHGPMQIIPSTFAQYAKPGETLDNYNDNLAVGHRIVQDLYQKFSGDPARIAVAYFSGPGNVSPMAFSAPYKKDTDDGRTKTSEYVNSVLHRLGAPGVNAPAPQAQPNPPRQAGVATPQPPQSQLGALLGQAFESMSAPTSGGGFGGGQVLDPPDQPAIRMPALETAPVRSAVPANFTQGVGPQLGSLAIQAQPQSVADPSSITQGAPSMTAMLGPLGTPNPSNPGDPRATNTPNPYARYTRLG